MNAKKNRGLLHKVDLNAHKLHKQVQNKEMAKYNKAINNIDLDTDISIQYDVGETQIKDLDPKELWLEKVIGESKNKESYNELCRSRMTKLILINAFLSFLVILISIIEYEKYYYPNFFSNRKNIPGYSDMNYDQIQTYLNDQYKGMNIRIICLILCILSIFCTFILNYIYYLKDYERKITISRKILIIIRIFYFFKLFYSFLY